MIALTLLLAGCTNDVITETQNNTTAESTAIQAIATTSPATTTEVVLTPEEILLNTMTLEEKVGQLFLARCPDTGAINDIQRYALGGYILFARDFEGSDPAAMRETTEDYQAASRIPLLIAVDEEGGSVCRVSCVSTFRDKRFSSPRNLFNKGGLESVLQAENEKCVLLSEIGINVNMAPVCDIATENSAFMYKRSLGQDAETTARFVSETVSVMRSHKVGSVLKHFPGYGNNADTHTGIAVDKRTLQEQETKDLIPFAAGIQNHCDAILVSHTIVHAFDEELPASLSPAIHTYLREEMGFTGVIITDDLDMQAITKKFGTQEAAVLAIIAGNDLLCTGNYATQHQAILDAIADGRISMEKIDQSVLRILRWKIDLGLIH